MTEQTQTQNQLLLNENNNTTKMMENIELEGNIESNTKIEANKPLIEQAKAFGLKPSNSAFDLNSIKPQEWITKRRETLKPWAEFASFSKFKKPDGPQQAASRIYKNLIHFQSNYLFVFVFLAIYCVLTSPFLLIAFMSVAGACYIIYLKNKEGNIKFFGQEFKLGQLYAIIGLLSIPLFLIAGGGSAIFWIIGASIFCIILHAVFYSRDEPADPFLLQMNIV